MTHPLPAELMSLQHVTAWLCEPLPDDVARSLERLSLAEDVQRVAVMPDVHLAGDVCIGTVVATERLIYPAAVGSDVGCGMAAVAFDATSELLANERSAAKLLAGLYDAVPIHKHHKGDAPQLPEALRTASLSDPSLVKLATREGRLQIGTLGRGNHFVEFQADENERLWLMVHSGSRGMGQGATAFHRHRTRQDDRRGLACFEADSDAGQAYLNDVEWTIRYASENRLAMERAVSELMQHCFGVSTDWSSQIHGNHNHVRLEGHGGCEQWVHRKGALPAAVGEAGVIPGSMGSRSFHVEGRGHAASLCSSSHGAGRAMSRKEAAKNIRLRDFERQMQGIWFDRRHAPALRDEAPAVYKDVHRVMRAQKDLTRIVRELRPLLCFKGA